MAKKEMTIEKARIELEEIKNAYELAYDRISKDGDSEITGWLFRLNHKIGNIEEKLDDLKLEKVRTNKKTEKEIELEEKVLELEDFLKQL